MEINLQLILTKRVIVQSELNYQHNITAWHRILCTFGGKTKCETEGDVTSSVWSASPPT